MNFLLQTSFPMTWLVIALIGASIHASRTTRLTKLEVWQRWWAGAALGGGSAWMTLSFLTIPGFMAHAIGFGITPFVTEIAFANLGLAVGGFRAIRAGSRERLTIGLGAGMFLWGATIGHVYQWVVNENGSVGNVGGVLVYDVLIPAVMVTLALVSARQSRALSTSSRGRQDTPRS